MDFDKFQQFQPKSLKEILEETKQQKISRIKEFAEAAKEAMQEWHQSHSASQVLRNGDDWNPVGTTYNGEGNRIIFYDVVGGAWGNVIDMDTRTHDVIDGGTGSDEIYGGWGNDVITGGENGNGQVGRDLMYGEEGRDIITAQAGDEAWGGQGKDQLHGYSGSSLWGGSESDIFHVHAQFIGGEFDNGPAEIHDFSSEDQLIVDFEESSRVLGNFGPERTDSGEKTIFYDEAGRQVAMINEFNPTDFSIDVSNDGMTVTITGSDFI